MVAPASFTAARREVQPKSPHLTADAAGQWCSLQWNPPAQNGALFKSSFDSKSCLALRQCVAYLWRFETRNATAC